MRCGGSWHPSVSSQLSPGENYLAHLRNARRLSPHTLQAYRRDLAVLRTMAAERRVEALAGTAVRRLVAARHGKGNSPRTLARALSSWRGLYEWLIRQRAVPAKPGVGVRAPRAARRLPEALSPDDAVRLVSLEDG